MKKLFKKLLRDVMFSKGQFLSIILVLATGVSFFTGLFVFTDSLNENLNLFYEEQNLADIWAYYDEISHDTIDHIQQMDGVAHAEGRVKLEGLSGTKELSVYTLSTENTINIPLLTDGRMPTDQTELILIEPTAEANQVFVDDVIEIAIGDDNYIFTVVGLFISPEYVLQIPDSSAVMPEYENFGVVFLHDSMRELFIGEQYNEVMISTEDNANVIDIIGMLADETAGNYRFAISREQHPSYTFISHRIQSIQEVSLVFPIIFFLVAAALVSISMSRIVVMQRGQIGIMKALGTRKQTIIFHYLSFALLMGVVGSAIGGVIGIFLLPHLLINLVTIYFTMPAVVLSGGFLYAVIGSILAIIFASVATQISCHAVLKESASSLMRLQPPKSAKNIWLENREKIWSKLSYGTKLILRNVFLTKRRAIIGTIGIISGYALIFSSLGLQGTFRFAMNDYLYNLNNHDLQLILNQPDESLTADISEFGSITETTRLHGIVALDEDVEIGVSVLPRDTEAVRLYNRRNERVFPPEEGVLITQGFAQEHEITVGDSVPITLNHASGSYEIIIEVSDIVLSYLGQGVFTSFDALEVFGIELMITTYYLNVCDDVEVNDVVAVFKEIENINTVRTRADLQELMASAQDLITTIVSVMIIASAILTFAVIFNLTSINLFDRRRDIATLRVLGYHYSEVDRLILVENLILASFGSMVGIGFGLLMQYGLINFVGAADAHLPFRLIWWSFPISIGIVFTFVLVVNFLSKKKIRQIDMVESLKSVE